MQSKHTSMEPGKHAVSTHKDMKGHSPAFSTWHPERVHFPKGASSKNDGSIVSGSNHMRFSLSFPARTRGRALMFIFIYTEGVVMGAEFLSDSWGLSFSDSWGLRFFQQKKTAHHLHLLVQGHGYVFVFVFFFVFLFVWCLCS